MPKKQGSKYNKGWFGEYGGQFVPEVLMPALQELEEAYTAAKTDHNFQKQLELLLINYAGRPTPIYYASNLSKVCRGADIYMKREDLLHTGAHKINNALGQALLAVKTGKTRIIAETGAGQHGVATATVCAMLGIECVIYMGKDDVIRQATNVYKMRLLGAEVKEVTLGSRTLKDAINEAIRDWVTNVKTTHYLLGSAVGPHPYPLMVRDFQAVIGIEARRQILEMTGSLPTCAVACVGGGSNAIGFFSTFVDETSVNLIGVEAGGKGDLTGQHAATLTRGTEGILHGTKSYLLQDQHGFIAETHSISAGLDYPGVGPEHAFLKDSGRVTYVSATDIEALQGFNDLVKYEGIIPALEPAHAIGYVCKNVAPKLKQADCVLICLSGRGDKDIDHIRAIMR